MNYTILRHAVGINYCSDIPHVIPHLQIVLLINYFNGITNTEIVDSFETAVSEGLNDANQGSVFLLSPACASFDMFKNYEDRGFQFKKIVNEIK